MQPIGMRAACWPSGVEWEKSGLIDLVERRKESKDGAVGWRSVAFVCSAPRVDGRQWTVVHYSRPTRAVLSRFPDPRATQPCGSPCRTPTSACNWPTRPPPCHFVSCSHSLATVPYQHAAQSPSHLHHTPQMQYPAMYASLRWFSEQRTTKAMG